MSCIGRSWARSRGLSCCSRPIQQDRGERLKERRQPLVGEAASIWHRERCGVQDTDARACVFNSCFGPVTNPDFDQCHCAGHEWGDRSVLTEDVRAERRRPAGDMHPSWSDLGLRRLFLRSHGELLCEFAERCPVGLYVAEFCGALSVSD